MDTLDKDFRKKLKNTYLEIGEKILKAEIELMKDFRFHNLERIIKSFLKKICKDFNTEIPSIFVLPRFIVLQVSDGASEYGTYRAWTKSLYLSVEDLCFFNVCHELAHHLIY